MDLTFKGFGIITTIYVAPTISYKGWLTARKGQHSSWKHGFVCRFLWFGWLLRWGKIPYYKTPRGQFEKLIEQANDGDYPPYFMEQSH